MGTKIRSELSKNNPYYIPKERYYELKYHCLQYNDWKKKRADYINSIGPMSSALRPVRGSSITDPVTRMAMVIAYYDELITEVEQCCKDAEPEIQYYILEGVTKGMSYDTLLARYEIPCGKDMYYDRYRRFFYLLDRSRRQY